MPKSRKEKKDGRKNHRRIKKGVGNGVFAKK